MIQLHNNKTQHIEMPISITVISAHENLRSELQINTSNKKDGILSDILLYG